MNEEPMEPLPEELSALLARVRGIPPVDAATAARIRRRVGASISGGGGGGGGGASAGRLVRAAALVGLGAIGGAAAHAWLTHPVPVQVARPEPGITAAPLPAASLPLVLAPPPAPTLPDQLHATAVAPPTVTRTDRPSTADERDTDSLARERTIVDAARGALAHGRADDALAALARHARLYPRGQLADMREALAVQALLRAGRVDEARARAAAFERDYPESLLRSGVEAALVDPP